MSKTEEIINFPTEEQQLIAIAEAIEEQIAILDTVQQQQQPQGILPVKGWLDNIIKTVLTATCAIDDIANTLDAIIPGIDKYAELITKSNEVKAIIDLISSGKSAYHEVKPLFANLIEEIRNIAKTIRDRVSPPAPPVEEVVEVVEEIVEEPVEETIEGAIAVEPEVEVNLDSEVFED